MSDKEAWKDTGPRALRDQGRPGQARDGVRPGLRHQLPECRARQSQLDRHGAPRGLLPARPVRDHSRASACSTCRRASAACPGRRASPRASSAWLAKHADMPGASVLAAMVPWAVKKFGFDRRRLRPRARRLDHRRQLPGARPDARAQRADRPRVPAVGDVRRAAPQGHVPPLRGRGRHGGHVLHLQVDEDQPAAQCRATRSRWARRSSRPTSRCRTSRTTT